MNENQNKDTKVQVIDLIEVVRKLWARRMLFIKNCFIAAVVGVIIAFSFPKEYETKVSLAPESSGGGMAMSGGLASLASLAGISLGGGGGDDAISPDLYPDILKTSPFLVGLFNVPVESKDGKLKTTFYHYMEKDMRAPWFSYVIGAPMKALGWFVKLFKEKKEKGDPATANYFSLTIEQEKMCKDITERISAVINKKTGVISISVKMQDPLIAAALADTVKDRLQNYIIEYRTSKARKDLEFAEDLYEKSKASYQKAQAEYADYVDNNMDMVLQRYRVEEERLKNEVNITYNVYSQMSQQLQVSKAKLQEKTPVYTVVQPSTMSEKAVSPKKFVILLFFCFLGFMGTAGWVLFKENIKMVWRKLRK